MPLYQSARTYGLRTAQMRLHSVASDVMREFGAIRTIDPGTSQLSRPTLDETPGSHTIFLGCFVKDLVHPSRSDRFQQP